MPGGEYSASGSASSGVTQSSAVSVIGGGGKQTWMLLAIAGVAILTVAMFAFVMWKKG